MISAALDDLTHDSGNRNRLVRRRLDTSVALPHREKLATEADILLDDTQLLCRCRCLRGSLFRFRFGRSNFFASSCT